MIDKLKIKGAREHNLKNISLELPKNSLVVLSGLSGSGKSSLAFDTIFAEGQRRYMESLSSYARQFLGRMEKPDVDSIEGLSPAIAIEQKSTNRNPRSTVGTVTEIYDYYRLLFARVGKKYCPKCGREISEMSIDQIISIIFSHKEDGRIMVLAPVARGKKGEFKKTLEDACRLGYVRAMIDKHIYSLDEDIPSLDKNVKIDMFTEHDPFGVGMAIMAMAIVFAGLLLLYLLFRLIGQISVLIKKRNAMRVHGISDKEEAKEKGFGREAGEVYAAIAMALYQHLEAHDVEDTILTINKVKKAYSPWNSKIYSLREIPSKK